MTNYTSLESSCALLLESAKKFQICKNWIFYRKIQLYSKNVCKKKFVQKIKNYTFLKSPWPCHFKYAKIYLKFCKKFCIFEMAWSRAFQKCIIYHFLDNFKHFYYITRFCNKKFDFCKFAILLQILKVEHKSFPMMYNLSYLDIKHGI